MSLQFWTRAEAEQLSAMVRSGEYTRRKIANITGRTLNSVTGKIYRDGIGGPNEYLRHNENVAVHKPVGGAMESSWDRAVFEPWSVYRARRMAERQKIREMCDA